MVKHMTLTPDQKLTEQQIAEIDAAMTRPIVYDEDAPALTPETFAAFKRAVAERDAAKSRKII